MARFPIEWFHGSQPRLTALKAGCPIMPAYDLTRVISHKPGRVSLVSLVNEGGGPCLEHNGVRDGWLDRVLEVAQADVIPHPTSTMPYGLEWPTSRELNMEPIGEVAIRPDEFLSEEAIRRLKERAGGSRS